jgi:hypothetical protein
MFDRVRRYQYIKPSNRVPRPDDDNSKEASRDSRLTFGKEVPGSFVDQRI